MPDRRANIGASIRARLLNLSRQSGQGMDLLLTRYVLERFLYRLSLSPYRERFVLKGALLLTTWFDDPHRPTRDVDLLGFGDPTPAVVLAMFREIFAVPVDDGVDFDGDGLRGDRIREELEYGGVRLRTTARLAAARIAVTIDVGFGDAIEPGVEDIELPVLLDMPKLQLRAYPREVVIAEKFHAMVLLGRANSRMKDFYDVWQLLNSYEFDNDRLVRAISATFARRKTALPNSTPDALSAAFAEDPIKQRQWAAFVRDLTPTVPPLMTIVSDVSARLMPMLTEFQRVVPEAPGNRRRE